MNDKEKIRAYIEKLHKEHRGSEGDSIFRRALRTVLFYIDSMQQEPVSDSLQDVADNKAQEAYPVRTKTNKTGTGDYDPNLPRRKAYVKGFVDGYNFRTNKVEDNDTNT